MAYDHVTAREKLSTTWRLLAEQMIALGYDRADVIATLTGVGLSFGLELGAPDEPRLAEEDPDPRLPRVVCDFGRRAS
jgi:hypothetical protein